MDILGLGPPPHQYVWPPHWPPNTQVLEPPLDAPQRRRLVPTTSLEVSSRNTI